MDNIRKNSKKIKNISVCSFPQKKSLFSAIARFREGKEVVYLIHYLKIFKNN